MLLEWYLSDRRGIWFVRSQLKLQLTKAISIFIKHRLKHFYKEKKKRSQACHLYVTFQSRTEIFC